MIYKDLQLDPFQKQAIEAIDRGESVLICAPTGAGKTLIAEYAIEKCIKEKRRIIYTAPIKALNNQKFRDFSREYGNKIGIKTGDVCLNPDAPVMLMTTEIFRNTIFESSDSLDGVDYAILDEIHYLDDIERGTVWEECIIFAPQSIGLICLSATVPNYQDLANWIQKIRSNKLATIIERRRPIPLKNYLYVPALGIKTLKELEDIENHRSPKTTRALKIKQDHRWKTGLIQILQGSGKLPCLFFAFSRKECEGNARSIKLQLLDNEERGKMISLYKNLCKQFVSEEDKELTMLLSRGICYHHAGLLPTTKEIIERIFSSGLLKVLFATETFAVGVNMPAKTVVFSSIIKFDGRRSHPIKTREHHQMSGRAGRRGIDKVGYCYTVCNWPTIGVRSIKSVTSGQIEPIMSQFNLSYSTILSLYERLQDKIYYACEQSFASDLGSKIDILKKRIVVLKSLGYIPPQTGQPASSMLTNKGHFAKQIYGYELPISELLFSGLLSNVNHEELAILACAICYESRKGAFYTEIKEPRFKWLKNSALRITGRINYFERSLGIKDIYTTNPLSFRLSSVIRAWSRGSTFDQLRRFTNIDEGDIVRFMRLSIQILRNLLHASDNPALIQRCKTAIERINRDEVDAERQLRLGADPKLEKTLDT